jgi:hypothetical protein
MGYWMVNGKQMPDEEYTELKRQEELAREQIRQEAAALVKRLGETYTELTNLMEQNPGLAQAMNTDNEAREQAIYQKLGQNLRQANQSPRCRWVKQDGRCCGSPQMRKHIYCYAHLQMMEARAVALRIPALEDANAVQIAVMQVQKALIEDTITVKKAGLLFYSLQLAMTNVGQTTFGEAADQELVTDTVDEQDALGEEAALSHLRPAFSQKEDQPAAERHGSNGGNAKASLAAIDEDERGLQTEQAARVVTMAM